LSRDEILQRIRNAKTDMEREHWQDQLSRWDGLENIYHAKYSDRVQKLRYKPKPKPKGRIDARSHKHAVIDASKGASGLSGSIAPVASAYAWAKGNGYIDEEAIIHQVVSVIPNHVWVIVSLLGVGWWLVAYAIRLAQKREQEY